MKFSLYYLTSSGLELGPLGIATKSLIERGHDIGVQARSAAQLQDRHRAKEALTGAISSSAIVVNLHGGTASCPIFRELMEMLEAMPAKRRPYLHVEATAGDEDSLEAARKYSPEFAKDTWRTIHKYLLYGGAQNMKNLILYLARLAGFTLPPPQCPTPLPTEGIYHPDMGYLTEINPYLKERIRPGAPTLGFWFYQAHWLNNDLHFIDALIKEVEAQGANVIPVFHHRYKDKDRGNPGADHVVEKYFMDGEKARIDALINPLLFSLKIAGHEYDGLLERLDVPVLQAMVSLGPRSAWEKSDHGLTYMDVTYSAAQPEMDGALITVPVATREVGGIDPVTGAQITKYEPVAERVKKFVSLALNWAKLRKKANHQKRIAIVFHHYPPRNDRIGCAVGLDSFQSINHLLQSLKSHGYSVDTVYDSGDDLAKRLLSGITPDMRFKDLNYLGLSAKIRLTQGEYTKWFHRHPGCIRSGMSAAWGKPPGSHMVEAGEFLIPGILNGNIFITIQPSRGSIEKAREHCHDPMLPPPHCYLAQYLWIRHVFKADAVIHVGKHGTLEWLPGKALGLSNTCYPDLAIEDLPNIYPYIINDPSEGTQAKRRSFACIIDHLTPAFTKADLHDELARLDNLLTEYRDALQEEPARANAIEGLIWQAVTEANLHHDIEIEKDEAMQNFPAFLERLHGYLHELSDTMIGDGLHVLGQPPEGERLVEFLAQLTRLDTGGIRSLRALCAEEMDIDLDDIIDNAGKSLKRYSNQEGRRLLDLVHDRAKAVIQDLLKYEGGQGALEAILQGHFPRLGAKAKDTLHYIAEVLIPAIGQTQNEIAACIKALSGRFVPPGPSGAPTRGQADILPTGRNFYSVDPLKIPLKGGLGTGAYHGPGPPGPPP